MGSSLLWSHQHVHLVRSADREWEWDSALHRFSLDLGAFGFKQYQLNKAWSVMRVRSWLVHVLYGVRYEQEIVVPPVVLLMSHTASRNFGFPGGTEVPHGLEQVP